MELNKYGGRKFASMIVGVSFGVLFILGCLINDKILELEQFGMLVLGTIMAYMGSNALKEKYKNMEPKK